MGAIKLEIVEDVLNDEQVRELRAFAVMARGELLGLDVRVPRCTNGMHVAIEWLQRKGLLEGSRLTLAGWKYLAAIERIPYAAPECACCGGACDEESPLCVSCDDRARLAARIG